MLVNTVTQEDGSSKEDKIRPIRNLILKENVMNSYFLKRLERSSQRGNIKTIRSTEAKKKKKEEVFKMLNLIPPEKNIKMFG